MWERNTTAGLNGVPGRAWALTFKVVSKKMRHIFNRCLREGVFPPIWRKAKLVLLRKESKPAGTPAGYRPICLLDEEAKLFERVIAGRLIRHLEQVGPDLHERQYGFRRGRSIVDAILHVRSLVSLDSAVREGGVAVEVSLDITNAFNTLPWDRVGRALEEHEIPPYLRRIPGLSVGGWSMGTKRAPPCSGMCTAGFRRGRYSARICGTSSTTPLEAGSSSPWLQRGVLCGRHCRDDGRGGSVV